MNTVIFDEVAVLWAEHRGAPWPDDLYRMDDHDGDLVEIDGAMAGCVHSYVAGGGTLDEERFRSLQDCAHHLRSVLPRLRGESAGYVRRLIQLAQLIEDDRRSAS